MNESSVIKIQRFFRRHRSRRANNTEGISLSHAALPTVVATPKSNPPQADKIEAWVKMHDWDRQLLARSVASVIHHVSFPHFQFGLKMAIKKFNRHLSSLPIAQQAYGIILDDRPGKSCCWVTKLAEKYLATPPIEILPQSSVATMTNISIAYHEHASTYVPPTAMKHLVLIDDASYSGGLLSGFLKWYYQIFCVANPAQLNVQLHLIVPFMSTEAKARLTQLGNVLIHSQETLRSFQLKGTAFSGTTASYFDHKIPEGGSSTIQCIADGRLLDNRRGIRFIELCKPPYKP